MSGATSDLVYVSPSSGRAVCRREGEPWKQKLLRLPAFLSGESKEPPSSDDIADGFTLTRYFLLRHVIEPRGLKLSDVRASFLAAVTRSTAPLALV